MDSSSLNSSKCEICYTTEMRMDYTSTTLLLAVLLLASAVADDISHDSLCKSMVETKGYICEEHKVSTKIACFLVYKAFLFCDLN